MAKRNENKRNKPNSSEDMKYTAITIRDKPAMTTGMIIKRFLLYSGNPHVSLLVDFGFFITRMMLLMRRMMIIMRVQGPFENELKAKFITTRLKVADGNRLVLRLLVSPMVWTWF